MSALPISGGLCYCFLYGSLLNCGEINFYIHILADQYATGEHKSGRELELAAISEPQTAGQRGVPQLHAVVSPGVPLGASITDPTALTWYGADDLIVLNSASTGYGLYQVPVDGQPASGPKATLPGTISITADGPANVLVAGLSDGRLAVSTSLDGSWQTLSEPGRDPAYPG